MITVGSVDMEIKIFFIEPFDAFIRNEMNMLAGRPPLSTLGNPKAWFLTKDRVSIRKIFLPIENAESRIYFCTFIS